MQATGSQNVNSMNSTYHSTSLTTSARLRLALLDMNSQLPIPLQVDWEAVQLTDLYLLDKETSLQPDFMSLVSLSIVSCTPLTFCLSSFSSLGPLGFCCTITFPLKTRQASDALHHGWYPVCKPLPRTLM